MDQLDELEKICVACESKHASIHASISTCERLSLTGARSLRHHRRSGSLILRIELAGLHNVIHCIRHLLQLRNLQVSSHDILLETFDSVGLFGDLVAQLEDQLSAIVARLVEEMAARHGAVQLLVDDVALGGALRVEEGAFAKICSHNICKQIIEAFYFDCWAF